MQLIHESDCHWRLGHDCTCEKSDPRDATIARLTAELEAVRAQRDEADRRAGAAERKNESLLDSESRRANWLHKAKIERGYHSNVSFDLVWKETCEKADSADALLGAAYRAAAQVVDTSGDSAVTEALGQQLCCSGHHCGCHGADVGTFLMHMIRDLTPADATAALARIKAEAELAGWKRGRDDSAERVHSMWASTSAEHIEAIRALPVPADLAARLAKEAGE